MKTASSNTGSSTRKPLAETQLAVAAHALTIEGLEAGEAPPEWIHIMPAGTCHGVDGRGPYTLKDPAAVIAASMKPGRPVPIDYNHQSVYAVVNGGQSPAAGWITEMQARADGIWAKPDWTKAGGAAVANRDYRYISPTFQHDKKTGEVRLIQSAALVNNPNLAELPAICAAIDGVIEGTPMEELLKALRIALAIDAEADQTVILAACSTLREEAKALAGLGPDLGLATNASVGDIITAAKARMIKTETGTPDPAAYVPMAMFAEVQKDLAALKGEGAKSRAAGAVDAGVEQGKITPAQKDWALAYAAKDPDGFEAYLKGAPAIVTPNGKGVVAGKVPDTTVLSAIDVEVCSRMGIKPEDLLKAKQALRQEAA